MDERIEDYFSNQLQASEKARFEADLATNPSLADEVAFYIQARQSARNLALQQRHQEWKSSRAALPPQKNVRTGYYAAAAVLALALGIAWLVVRHQPEPGQLADRYIEQHFATLSVQMDAAGDSLQLALGRYNTGDFSGALSVSEKILERTPENAEAIKTAGLAALRSEKYGLAIDYFHRLAGMQELYANPGLFYEAIAYLKRNEEGDLIKAKGLLQQVVLQNLDEKKEAQQWLDELSE